MIPKFDINVVSRNMKAKALSNKTNNKNECALNKNKIMGNNIISETETDHLRIWDCTSISDVKNLPKLIFKTVNLIKRNKDAPSHKIENRGEQVIVEIVNDNLISRMPVILEKLLFHTSNHNISKLALDKDNEIFKWLSILEFKSIWTSCSKMNKSLDIILYRNPQKIKDKLKMNELIKEYHDTLYGGHIGIKRCINKLKQKYVWKDMKTMVKKYINNCEQCNRVKIIKYVKEQYVETDTPDTAFETISIDLVGPLRPSFGYKYILTIQCELTKFVEAFPIETKEAYTVAKT